MYCQRAYLSAQNCQTFLPCTQVIFYNNKYLKKLISSDLALIKPFFKFYQNSLPINYAKDTKGYEDVYNTMSFDELNMCFSKALTGFL